MNTTRTIDIFAAGMAIFAMFFGAGNIIFPLALGQYALDKTPDALLGLILTSVIMPFAGLLTMFLYKGQVSTFFNRIGKTPGLLLACFTIALLGPLGAAPRCIVLAYSTISLSLPGIPLVLFSAMTCLLIFFLVYNKGNLLSIIGYFLSPCKIFLLLLIIVIGFLNASELHSLVSIDSHSTLFFQGLQEGYNTLDLLGAFFFAPVIIDSLANKGEGSQKFLLKASVIGAFLLTIVYIGFCFLAYIYAPELEGISRDHLLGTIAFKVLGSQGGILVSLTVAVACFTTAIALVAAFADFVQKEVFSNRVKYTPIIIGTLLVTFAVSIFGFQGIAAFLTPILEISYPVLIILTIYNLLYYFLNKSKAN